MDDKDFWRNEKVAFLALSTIKGVSYWTLRKFSESGLSYKEALKDLEKLKLTDTRDRENLNSLEIKNSLSQENLWQSGLNLARYLAANRTQLYLNGEPEFPEKLKDIQDEPKWIFVQGSLQNLSRPAIAIVGTRKPNEDGLFLTKFAVACLANLECVTVSGLALGIDQLCHSESIRYSIPTIAVLGTGILQNYPRGSEPLREQILEHGGTIVTEYLPHQSYSAENFVRRNRLQAALGDILIPSQWDIKSGTAHTVRFAAKGRKLIINLHLPLMREKRPEILFSASEYGAVPYEIPTCTEELISIIKARALGIAETVETTDYEIPEAPSLPSNNTEPDFKLTPTEEAPENIPNQLPLI